MNRSLWLGLCIVQWNANSIIAHGLEFKNYISQLESQPDVICVQETYLKPDLKYSLSGYEVIRKEGLNGRGGVAVFVKKGIKYKDVNILQNLEGISLKVTTNIGDLEIFNLYLSPSVIVSENELSDILSKNNIFVCGDFNAKSELWGNSKTDSRGKMIENILETNDVVILNTGLKTHMYSGGESAIDLSFTSPRYAALSSWDVVDNTFGSDHAVIITKIQSIAAYEEENLGRWSFKKADWENFSRECDTVLDNVNFEVDLEEVNSYISDGIFNIASKYIPRSKGGKTVKKNGLFWNEECEIAVKNRERCRNKVRRTRDPKDWIEYKKYRAIAVKVIKSTKRRKWRDYCSTLNRNSNLSSVWRVVKKMNNAYSGEKITTIKSGDIVATENIDKANLLGKSFAKVSSDANYSEKFSKHKESFENNNNNLFNKRASNDSILNATFKMSEFKKALKKCKNTSPGKDQICYEMFKHMSETSCKVILKFYNLVWSTGYVPSSWRHALIIPLLKPGKAKSDTLSYRPIALTSNICKLMERMITNRLNWFMEKHDLFNVNQSGFRKRRSTIDQLIKLSDDIVKSIANKSVVLGVFLDIEKAYDMIWKKGLLYKLDKLGIDGNMFNWINGFLHNRVLQVKVGEAISDEFNVQNGVPQGSVISPILFLIAINDLNLSGMQVSIFADDTAIWKAGRNIKYIKRQVQRAINDLETWCDQWGFKVSKAKTKVILFHRKKCKEPIDIYFQGTKLEQEKQVKFLGLIFDQKLTWKDHIDYVVKKCKKRINLLKVISGSKWGASKEVLSSVYKGLIRSVIDYGSEVYDTSVKTHKNKLDKIQAQCLRICCGALMTTPINALQVECGDMPLDLRRLWLQCKLAVKYKFNPNHPTSACFKEAYDGKYQDSFNSIFNKVNEYTKDLNIEGQEIIVDNIPYWECGDIKVCLDLANNISKKDIPVINLAHSKEYLQKWNNHLKVYTDGSKSENKTGCAFYVPEMGFKKCMRLTDNTSVCESELVAILLAISWLAENPPFQFVILSDSLSALQAIEGDKLSKLVCEIRYQIFMLQNKGINVEFAWIPGHVGLRGNEVADQLAKEALSHENVELTISPEMADILKDMKGVIMRLWQDRWNKDVKGRFYFKSENKVSLKVKYTDSNRRKEVCMTRIRFGHCWLNSTRCLIGKHPDGNCDFCQFPENVQHYLLECIEFQHLQEELVNMLMSKSLKVDSTSLLGNKSHYDKIWKYVLGTKKFI